VTRAAQVVFAALVVATFGAFFAAQRLKHGPTLVQKFNRDPIFSPNRDGRLDRESINFLIKSRDDVTVDVVDSRGDRVRRLADNRSLAAYTGLFLKWDGLTDGGRMAPDGLYRVRVALRREGRSVVVPKSFRKDTVAPAVRVVGIGPANTPGPELLPNAQGKVTIRFSAPPRKKLVTIWRTYPGPLTRVLGPDAVADDQNSYEWDGTRHGTKLRPGTYLAVVEAQDSAQNIGSSVPLRRGRGRTPLIRYGQRLPPTGPPGHGGITIRYLGVQAQNAPLPAGRSATIPFDARGAKVTWSLRRAGGAPEPIRRGSASPPAMKVPVPRGESGLYLLTVRAGSHVTRIPLIARASTAHRVLVVLPALTWAGHNPVDDDGDGVVNTLDRGVSSKINRVSVGDGSGLPQGLAQHEAPLLAYLDRNHHRYDLTTDAALLAGIGPRKLNAYSGVLLPGDTRWLPAKLGAQLRRFVRNGGFLASFGTASLRAQANVSRRGRLTDPTALAESDLFAAKLQAGSGTQTLIATAPDRLALFQNGTGELAGYDRFEITTNPGRGRLSSAATQAGRTVVLAERFGKGVVLRTGLAQLPTHLADRNTAALMERTWTLLSR
jgi:flagellar hook assembly protein FlgD